MKLPDTVFAFRRTFGSRVEGNVQLEFRAALLQLAERHDAAESRLFAKFADDAQDALYRLLTETVRFAERSAFDDQQRMPPRVWPVPPEDERGDRDIGPEEQLRTQPDDSLDHALAH